MSNKTGLDSTFEKTRENLTYLLNSGNLSISSFAKLLNISKSYISLWLSGSRVPSMKIVLDTCKIFDVTVDDFCYSDLQNFVHAGTAMPKNDDDVLALTMFQELNNYNRETVLRVMQGLCTVGNSESDFNQSVLPSPSEVNKS